MGNRWTLVCVVTIFIIGLCFAEQPVSANESKITEVCPTQSIQPRAADFQPGGIILTYFDRNSIWVYNIERGTRYPLPDTRPCKSNCRLSPDSRWLSYVDPMTGLYERMRMDGTQRSRVVEYANDVQWWSDDTFLIWTPAHRAYLLADGSNDRVFLGVDAVVSVQPGGYWAVKIYQDGDHFGRMLINLETYQLQGVAFSSQPLGEDRPYFNTASWSPSGDWLAYAAPVMVDGEQVSAELFGIRPQEGATPQQLTQLYDAYGPVRVNGRVSTDLSWSPDGRKIAFWVLKLNGENPETDATDAIIHVLDIETGEVRAYCGFANAEHSPQIVRLHWSPDSSHIAFGGNIPNDDKGYLLLALNVESGVFTELSDGIFPALGIPDLIAWGVPPGS